MCNYHALVFALMLCLWLLFTHVGSNVSLLCDITYQLANTWHCVLDQYNCLSPYITVASILWCNHVPHNSNLYMLLQIYANILQYIWTRDILIRSILCGILYVCYIYMSIDDNNLIFHQVEGFLRSKDYLTEACLDCALINYANCYQQEVVSSKSIHAEIIKMSGCIVFALCHIFIQKSYKCVCA